MKLSVANRAHRPALTSTRGDQNSRPDGPKSSAVTPPDSFQPSEFEVRKTKAVELMDNPSLLRPNPKGLLSTAWESLGTVTRNLAGHFLHGPIPKPVPVEEARHSGGQDSAELIQAYGRSDDEKLNSRLGKAVELTRQALPNAPFREMVVLDTDEFWGSAEADGSILVSRGLMAKVSDEELLFVVGHEMGHLRQKHNAQRLAYEQRLATAKSAGQQAYFAQRMMEFYHNAENEADDFGVRVLEHHGLGREHAVAYHIRNMSGVQGGDPASETHPSDADRAFRAIVSD